MTSNGKVAVPRQRGMAAVEFALILPAFLLLLALPLGFGRVLWHYTAVQKAVQDATRFVSSLPANALNDPTRMADAEATARAIVAAETVELHPGSLPPAVSVLCDALYCDGLSLPDNVTVGIRLSIEDIFLPDVAQAHALLNVRSTMAYSGN
jgi:hypothetical protein